MILEVSESNSEQGRDRSLYLTEGVLTIEGFLDFSEKDASMSFE